MRLRIFEIYGIKIDGDGSYDAEFELVEAVVAEMLRVIKF